MRRKIPLSEKREKEPSEKNEKPSQAGHVSTSLQALGLLSNKHCVIGCPRERHPPLYSSWENAGNSHRLETKVKLQAPDLVTLLNSGRQWSPKWGEWLEKSEYFVFSERGKHGCFMKQQN